jgi:hypothetical protein
MNSNMNEHPAQQGTAMSIDMITTHEAGQSGNTTNDWKANLPRKRITGPQMKQVLKLCGKKVNDFAAFLDRSDNYVLQSLGYLSVPIPLTYYDALKCFVGQENFYCALRELGIEP